MSKKRLQDFENTEIVYAEGLTILQLNTGLNLYNATYEEESNYQSSNMMWFGIEKKDVMYEPKYGNIINEYTVTSPLFILLLDPENKQNINFILKLLTDDSDIDCFIHNWIIGNGEEQGRYTEVDCDYQVVNKLVDILPEFRINGIGTGTGRGEQAHHPEILLFNNSFDKFAFTGSDHSIKNHPIYRPTLDRRARQAAKIAARKARREAAQREAAQRQAAQREAAQTNQGSINRRLFGFGS